MNQIKKAAIFQKLHTPGSPVILYNAWDAGSAKVIANAGAKAIATSSWAIAAAHGFKDGEDIPLSFVKEIVTRIPVNVDVPVSMDFEGGYGDDDKFLAKNISDLIELGIVGINFEDRIVKGKGLYSIDRQACRIAAIRKVADKKKINLFINARTDLFLNQSDHSKSIDDALDRAQAYKDAGASGFFVPGLKDKKLIAHICENVELPVNILVISGIPSNKQLAALGVARISYGATPIVESMGSLAKTVAKIYT